MEFSELKGKTIKKSHIEIVYGVGFMNPHIPHIRINALNTGFSSGYILKDKSTMCPYPGYVLSKSEVRELIHILQESLEKDK